MIGTPESRKTGMEGETGDVRVSVARMPRGKTTSPELNVQDATEPTLKCTT